MGPVLSLFSTPEVQRHTRVLWDIENVSVPSGIDTVEAVRALERWLETRGLWGAGVVGLITAFFNPDSVGTRMRDALNRANVEQVLASSKREDADRKLNARLERDLALLPIGAATAVVFITADMDFIEQLRRVKERGGPTVLLTTALHGSAHYNALAHSATETHLWRDIVCTAPAPAAAAESPAPAPPSAVESAGSLCSLCKERLPKEAFTSAQLKKSAAVRRCKVCLTASGGNGGSATYDAPVPVAEKAAAEKAAAEKAAAVRVAAEKAAAEKAAAEKAAAEKAAADKAAAEPVRYEARCSFWNGPKGFGFLSPVQHGKELYVNNKALCAACSHEGKQRSLRPGDLVSYALGSNHKGPCAIDVKLVSRAPAHMDEQRNDRSGPPAVLGKKGNRRAASVQV